MRVLLLCLCLLLVACESHIADTVNSDKQESSLPLESGPYLIVLGTSQDAGSPQIGCQKACCRDLFDNPDHSRKVTSLGVIDPVSGTSYLFEATPDIGTQLQVLQQWSGKREPIPDAIFLTHAHIGHYTGLQFLGKEAINAQEAAVYAMPRMQDYLRTNGPWGQLVTNNNITIHSLKADSIMVLSPRLSVRPFLVPHRDEYSETVGYEITGPNKKVLFIPDIDKWERWDRDISELVTGVDRAYVDATFFDGEELDTRDISQVPHPFVIESMSRFDKLPADIRAGVHFIHFNHTNTLLDTLSLNYKQVIEAGYGVARYGDRFEL